MPRIDSDQNAIEVIKGHLRLLYNKVQRSIHCSVRASTIQVDLPQYTPIEIGAYLNAQTFLCKLSRNQQILPTPGAQPHDDAYIFKPDGINHTNENAFRQYLGL